MVMFLLHIRQYSFGVQVNKPGNLTPLLHLFSLNLIHTNTVPYVLTLWLHIKDKESTSETAAPITYWGTIRQV